MADFAAERARATTPKPTNSFAAMHAQRRSRTTSADLAASRARGAVKGGFVKGAKKTAPPSAPSAASTAIEGSGRRKLPRDRDERIRLVMDAVRASSSHAEAAGRLGVTKARVEQIVSELEPTDDSRFRPAPPRAGALQVQHGVTTASATRLDDYGPTSSLSERLLFRGYGLMPTRHEDEGC